MALSGERRRVAEIAALRKGLAAAKARLAKLEARMAVAETPKAKRPIVGTESLRRKK